MPTNVLMPALSPTMTEGNLLKWNVKEGDPVRAGDVIAEIETDKATMEVEAVDEGVLRQIVVPEGTQGVQVNSVIAVIAGEGDDAKSEPAPAEPSQAKASPPAAKDSDPPTPARSDVAAAAPASGQAAATPPATPLAARMAAQAGLALGGLNGTGPRGRITKADVEAALGGPPQPRATAIGESGRRIFVSPLARRMAQQAGIPLESLSGSGPEGRIIKRDIESALQQPRPAIAAAAPPERPAARAAPPPSTSTPAPEAAPSRAPEMTGTPEFDLIPHTTMRKVIARRLTESKQTVPHFYLTVDCEVDQLMRMRQEVNEQAGESGVKVSVNDFVVKAAALALRKHPDVNASWTEEGIRRWHSADISVAVAIPGGLITPIIRSADHKGLAAISTEMKDLAGRARAGKLKPEEFQGGTFSVSNLGMYGVRQFDAVINPPQACILAVGASEQRPVVKSGQLAVATVMTCTLSCDHRVVDGALGAQWLASFKVLLERPAMMLL